MGKKVAVGRAKAAQVQQKTAKANEGVSSSSQRVTKCPMERPLYTNLASLKRDQGLRVSA